MDLNYSAEELAFRDEVRSWFEASIPADLRKKVLDYEELGMEAVWKITVENFPAFIVTDDKGNDFYSETTRSVEIS